MLTKKAQTKRNRLRPKPNSKNKPKITDEDKAYLEWLQLQTFSCMVCGTTYGIEMHHVRRDSVSERSNKRLIPLCYYHHRTSTELSAHGTPSLFRKKYPMEVQYKLADKIYNEYLQTI